MEGESLIMDILVTGSNGFVGKNLVANLMQTDHNIMQFDKSNTMDELITMVEKSDFIFHLAGINRPEKIEEFTEGNVDLIAQLLDAHKGANSKSPIVVSSSIQAELENPYGKSKLAGEKLVQEYGTDNNVETYIYRFSNLFGKWSRPNYNSVISTFCHNVARGIDITVNDPEITLNLTYIDDVLNEFNRALAGNPTMSDNSRYYIVPEVYSIKLGRIAELILEFKESRNNRMINDMSDPFTKKLYSTYLSYLPETEFSYPLVMHKDERGSFSEFIKSPQGGQVSVNISKPGVTKGQHWHHTKNEKFLVVHGTGVIRFRKIDTEDIIEYPVTSEKLEVVDIPVGYTHSIVNTGSDDMVTIMWVNELFDPNDTDTFPLEV